MTRVLPHDEAVGRAGLIKGMRAARTAHNIHERCVRPRTHASTACQALRRSFNAESKWSGH